jgi:hypothetical protein
MSIIPSAQASMVEDEIESKFLDIRDYYNNIIGIFHDIICRILFILRINVSYIIDVLELYLVNLFFMPFVYIILSFPFEILYYFLHAISDLIGCPYCSEKQLYNV